MNRTLLFSVILFLLCSAPGVSTAQPLGGHGVVNPLGGAITGTANGGLHFHINPSEDHPMFESLERDTYQYYALHGYEHYRGKDLQQVDRFRDIQYPKNQPYYPSRFDSFFGVDSYNPQ
jgi:hypothetical protein